ncbi:hypothetical protein BX666DRAFT_1877571 [Dichotomocladium elegans]|nr:hypothetical protein BX666DRAFT_1877571 [Dichotomocladium elegans]
MAPRRSINAAIFFSTIALVLGILAILGTTSIPSIFVVEIAQAQTNVDQLAQINEVDVTTGLLETIKNNLSQNSSLHTLRATASMIPFLLFTFLALSLSVFMGYVKKGTNPTKIWSICGIAVTLFACIFGTVSLAVSMSVYRSVFDQLLNYVSLARYHWGPAVYLVLAASACVLFTSLCFIASCFTFKPNEVVDEKTYQLEYDPYEVYTPQAYNPEDDHITYHHRY